MTRPAPAPVRIRTPTATQTARLYGFGAAQPQARLTAAELGARVGRTAEWIEARTGIRELRVLTPDTTLTELAVRAGAEALADAAVEPPAIDLVIGASCSLLPGSPELSASVARVLAPRAAHLDLNAACAGFSYGLAAAQSMIQTGAARRVLLVAAEHMTGIVDPADLGTSILFGDGAGAAVIGPAPDGAVSLGPPAWGSDGHSADLIAIPPGKRFLSMAGQQVFRWAVDHMRHVALRACRLAGVRPTDLDLFVPHQANGRIIDALADRLGIDPAIVSRDVTSSGNTSAASIPIAITKLRRAGQARTGQLALVIGFGAGLTYSAQVLRLP